MHLVSLWDEQQLADARARFPLFYDACLPHVPDPESGTRCAVVCDAENTVLAVMQQTHRQGTMREHCPLRLPFAGVP